MKWLTTTTTITAVVLVSMMCFVGTILVPTLENRFDTLSSNVRGFAARSQMSHRYYSYVHTLAGLQVAGCSHVAMLIGS